MTGIETVLLVSLVSLVTGVSVTCIVYHHCEHKKKKKKNKEETNVVIKYISNAALNANIVVERQQSINEVPIIRTVKEVDVTEELLYGPNYKSTRLMSSSSSSTFSNSGSDLNISDIHLPHLPHHHTLSDPSPETSPPRLTFSLATTKPSSNSNTVNLSMTVDSVSDLPSRDYGVNCDPLVQVSLFREDKSSDVSPFQVFRTPTLRNVRSPVYCFTTNIELEAKGMEDVLVVFTVIDNDRYIGEEILGNVALTLEDAKQTVKKPERYTVTQILKPIKPRLGKINIGITNISTSEKISFHISDISNIKPEGKMEDLNLYVKILQMSRKGRLVKKKKTLAKQGTTNPHFDETIDFGLNSSLRDNMNFVILVCDKIGQDAATDSEDDHLHEMTKDFSSGLSSRRKDICMGRLVIGGSVKGEKEKEHWSTILQTPNKMISHCHNVK